jgi:hypothetical protein
MLTEVVDAARKVLDADQNSLTFRTVTRMNVSIEPSTRKPGTAPAACSRSR